MSTLPCHTPRAASFNNDDGSAGSVLLHGSDDSICMTPASSVFIPLALSNKRAFSSLSPLDEETNECARTNAGHEDNDKNNDGASPTCTTG